MKKIMFIDDEAIFLFINTRVVERLGLACEIQTAQDGTAALEVLKQDLLAGKPLPDLIFVDINMPRLDGFGFVTAFRRFGIEAIENVTLVMLTSSVSNIDKDRAAGMGIEHFITKPLTDEDATMLIGAS